MNLRNPLQAFRDKQAIGECPFCRKPFVIMSVSVSWSEDHKAHDVDEAEIECGGGHRFVMGRPIFTDWELARRLVELLKDTGRG